MFQLTTSNTVGEVKEAIARERRKYADLNRQVN